MAGGGAGDSPVTDVTAATIRAALRVHYPSGAFAVLEEVRNGTGYARVQRYADAIVCSCWPSRGLWIAGVEIKVSRSDWLSELRQPGKSAEIQQWCDYWWIVAPAGLVRDGELPVAWGLLEYDPARRCKDKIAVRTAAPKLGAQPISVAFIASVMRSCAAEQQGLVARAVHEATEGLRAEMGAEEVERLRLEVSRLQAREKSREHDRAAMQSAVEEVHRLRAMLGMRWSGDAREAEAMLSAALRIKEARPALVAEQLRAAAAALDGLEEVRR